MPGSENTVGWGGGVDFDVDVDCEERDLDVFSTGSPNGK